MEHQSASALREPERRGKLHSVWVGEADCVASFHPVDAYELRTFACHDLFFDYLRSLQERGFRFQ